MHTILTENCRHVTYINNQNDAKSVCSCVCHKVSAPFYDKNTFSLVFCYNCQTRVFTSLYIFVQGLCFLHVSHAYRCSLDLLCFVTYPGMCCTVTGLHEKCTKLAMIMEICLS